MGALLTRSTASTKPRRTDSSSRANTVGLLAADAGVQQRHRQFQSDPRWLRTSDSTLRNGYANWRVDARRRFARAKTCGRGQRANKAPAHGAAGSHGPYGAYRPTRCAGSACFAAQAYDELRSTSPRAVSPARASRHEPRSSDRPPRVTNEVADADPSGGPELSYGAEVVLDGVALVDVAGARRARGTRNAYLLEPGCDDHRATANADW